MKWYPNQLEQACKRGDIPFLLLIYGEDTGRVRTLGQQALDAYGVDGDDPFASDRLSVEDLLQEPGRLLDVAGTVSFGGGKRLIRVHGLTGDLRKDELEKVKVALEFCLAESLQDVLILCPAPTVEATSGLVKLVEKDPRAAAVRCFHDSTRDMGAVINGYFRERGKSIAPDAAHWLLENLGNDRAVTLSELDKVDLYTGEQSTVTIDDVLAVVAGAPSVGVFRLCDALGNRDKPLADKLLQALIAEGEDETFITSMVYRHFDRLRQCKEHMEAGSSVQDAMKALRPPVNFGKDVFAQQVQRQPLKRLQNLHAHIFSLQHESRQGNVPPSLATVRKLLALGV